MIIRRCGSSVIQIKTCTPALACASDRVATRQHRQRDRVASRHAWPASECCGPATVPWPTRV